MNCQYQTWYKIGSRVDKCESEECSPQSFHTDDNLNTATPFNNRNKISNKNWDSRRDKSKSNHKNIPMEVHYQQPSLSLRKHLSGKFRS